MKTQASRQQNILHCFLKLLAITSPYYSPVISNADWIVLLSPSPANSNVSGKPAICKRGLSHLQSAMINSSIS